MGIGKATDLVIYEEQFWAGAFEVIAQQVNIFNAASRNSIRLIQQIMKGQYDKQSFFQDISGLISRRDMTSVAAATDLPMTQDELIGVKVHRNIGPVTHSIGALKLADTSMEEMSFTLGQMTAKAILKNQVNTGLIAAETAIEGQASLNYDATGLATKTLTYSHLVNGLALFGDRANEIVAWVMHSKPFFDLMEQGISDKITNVADVIIHQGTLGTLNRPAIVTDSAAIWDLNGTDTDTYSVLGLVENALVVTESEEQEIVGEKVTGLKQLAFRMQGEFGFSINCKGMKWDTENGGANPTDGALGTTTNWDKVATSDKDLLGVRIKVQ